MVKKIDLGELLIFINNHYVDERLLILVPHLYEDLQYEILWTSELNEPRWRIRQKNSKDIDYVDTADFISFLNKKKINLIEVHVELTQKVLINVAHLNLIVETSQELFGKELVDQACSNLKKYYEDLQETIEKIVIPDKKKKKSEKKQKPKLSLVKKKDEQDK